MTAKFEQNKSYGSEDGEIKIQCIMSLEKTDNVRALLIKDNDEHYQKHLLESILNLNSDILQSIKHQSYEVSEKQKFILYKIGHFCGYFVGCSSWELQEIQDYDKDKLCSILESAIRIIKS